tara:strand:- start:3182 stop:3361 length:180 start_codon:yes stop_codon:yes gene_type:complete
MTQHQLDKLEGVTFEHSGKILTAEEDEKYFILKSLMPQELIPTMYDKLIEVLDKQDKND